jgi:hypothetical protein
MKILKVAGLCLLGLLSLVVLLYLVGLAVNWRDQPPSATALQMKEILTNRPPVADADNSFVYLMGFSVPASTDPEVAGAKRVAWIKAVNLGTEKFDADPVKEDIGFNTAVSPPMKHMKELCADEHSVECRDAFLATFSQPRMDLETLQLSRYRVLLQRPVWREVLPLDLRATLPRYSEIMDGQRLMLAELGTRAKLAPPAEIADALRADFTFWRGVLKDSDYLISRMIAVAALRNHFFFGNLVLREMPAAQSGVIAAWSVPFSTEELSMRRAMAGELAFSEAVVRQELNGNADQLIVDPDDVRLTMLGRIGSTLARPFFQPQDQANYYAEVYLDFSRRFEVPLGKYLAAEADVKSLDSPEISFHVYNATGHVFRALSGPWQFGSYAVRTGSVEGMRRAALLTAQLRDRGVPLDAIADELKESGLRNPFDHQSFKWNTEERAVVYDGPDAERGRSRHPYFY